MSLRDELRGDAPPEPRGYTLIVPPDWGRFTANDAGRDELVDLLRARFREISRPDLFAQARAMAHRQWEQMRAHAAMEIYMPVVPPEEGGTPMTVLVSPWIAQGPFAQDVRARARGKTVEELDDGRGGHLYRWVGERLGEGEREGLDARELSYVLPFPGDNPRRGILLMAAIVHPGAEKAGAALEAFTALADSIVSTFTWRYA